MANAVAWKKECQLHACMQFVFLLWGRGCILWYVGKGCATDTLKPLGQQRHIPISMGVQPPCFEVVCIRVWIYFSNALFCILDVWQDFICVVVLRWLSQSKNFHGSKHETDSSIWDLVWIESRGRNKPTWLISQIVVFCSEAETLGKPKRCEP